MSEEKIRVKIYYDNYQGSFVPVEIIRVHLFLLKCLQKGYSLVYKVHGTFGPSKGQWVEIQLTKR